MGFKIRSIFGSIKSEAFKIREAFKNRSVFIWDFYRKEAYHARRRLNPKHLQFELQRISVWFEIRVAHAEEENNSWENEDTYSGYMCCLVAPVSRQLEPKFINLIPHRPQVYSCSGSTIVPVLDQETWKHFLNAGTNQEVTTGIF